VKLLIVPCVWRLIYRLVGRFATTPARILTADCTDNTDFACFFAGVLSSVPSVKSVAYSYPGPRELRESSRDQHIWPTVASLVCAAGAKDAIFEPQLDRCCRRDLHKKRDRGAEVERQQRLDVQPLQSHIGSQEIVELRTLERDSF